MVNKEEIARELHAHFQNANTNLSLDDYDDYEIDESGVVHVHTDCKCIEPFLSGQMHIQFGEVGGDFLISRMNLTSLKGCPTKVLGRFDCSENLLTSLQYAPKKCENLECDRNKLTNMTHAPIVSDTVSCAHNLLTELNTAPGAQEMFAAYNPFKTFRNMNKDIEKIDITYEADLPLLGLLVVQHVEIFDPDTGEYMENLSKILNQYAGKGPNNKGAMLQCAADLIKAGFKGNARW